MENISLDIYMCVYLCMYLHIRIRLEPSTALGMAMDIAHVEHARFLHMYIYKYIMP